MDDDLDDLLLQVAGRSEPAVHPHAKSAGKKRGRPVASDSDEDGNDGEELEGARGDEETEEGAYKPPAKKAARAPAKKRIVAKVWKRWLFCCTRF